MEEMDESRSPPMLACEHDSALLHKFMSCIKKTSIRDVENAFQMHEERASSGKTYRVNRNLPPNAKLDSKEVACAVLTNGGWQCEVPQCGAILNTTFITDLHLEAHGATTFDELVLRRTYLLYRVRESLQRQGLRRPPYH